MQSVSTRVAIVGAVAVVVVVAGAALVVGAALDRRVEGGGAPESAGIAAPAPVAAEQIEIGGWDVMVGPGHRVGGDRRVHAGSLAAVPDGELWLPSGEEMPFERTSVAFDDIPESVQVFIGSLGNVPLAVGVIEDGMSRRCIWIGLDAGTCGDVGAVLLAGRPERHLTWWFGVPEDASVVTLTGGTTELWQRPVSRLSAFVVETGAYKITAYDAAGNHLGAVNAGNRNPTVVTVEDGQVDRP